MEAFMVSLEIIKIEKSNYTLLDRNTNKTYTKVLEFYDLASPLKVGDKIAMHQELLDEKYSGFSWSYAFGNLENDAGRIVSSREDIDAVAVMQGDKITLLKRLYG